MFATTPAEFMSSVWTVTLLALALPLLGGLAATFGAIAWSRIRVSAGRLRGTPLAVSALVIGILLVLASPFVFAVAWRYSERKALSSGGGDEQATVQARAETDAPLASAQPAGPQPPAAPRAWSWSKALMSMGLLGLVVVIVGALTLLSVGAGAASRKLFWLPAAGGLFGLVVGIVGTIVGMVMAFSRIASLGGAANPADLAEGISMSLITSVMGLACLLLGVLGTGALAVYHGARRRAAAA
jgi:hypothetical protein